MLTITLCGRQSQYKLGVRHCGLRSFDGPQRLMKSPNDSVKTQKSFTMSGPLFLQSFVNEGLNFDVYYCLFFYCFVFVVLLQCPTFAYTY